MQLPVSQRYFEWQEVSFTQQGCGEACDSRIRADKHIKIT